MHDDYQNEIEKKYDNLIKNDESNDLIINQLGIEISKKKKELKNADN